MQRALSPASKSVYRTIFIDVSYSVKPGLPIWMAGRRQHGRRQNTSKKSRTRALPRVIETIHSDPIATISSTKVLIIHATHLAMTASYQWTLMPHLHPTPQHHL